MSRRTGGATFQIINGIFLGFVACLCLYPFWYVIIYSISDPKEAMKGLYFLPRSLTAANYIKVFQASDIMRAAFVSTARTLIGTVGTVLCCALFAYGVSKSELPFRKLMYRGTVLMMYIGIGLIPVYITYRKLGLTNNFLVYILPNLVSPFLIVLAKTFFEQLPKELEESAKIDGAGYFRIFWKIVLPVATPILATISIFQAVYLWNSYYDNLYFAFSNARLTTLPLVLFNYINQSLSSAVAGGRNALRAAGPTVSPTSIRMTVTVITTLPVLIVYPFFQRYFLKGLLVGAVKG
jgi:putative aldouronate transport system permease protein